MIGTPPIKMAVDAHHPAILTDAAASVASATESVASAAEDDPLWYKDAIIYEAHVKSFFDSNNDGVGDFQGLTLKLDYLQGLGVTCIWLLPFFPSPLKDDGYDVADYLNIHPQYGTLDDFKAFVRATHERHIKVLIELVVNHTSDQHAWFQRARLAPPGSPERAFYVWSDTDTRFPETRIIFSDTERSNWTYDPVAKQYYWHRFFSHQPDLNHNNPAVVEAVIGVMKFWLDLGVDALRLDAVPYLCVREGTSNENLPETHEVLKRVRRELDASYRSRMLLAEANQWPSDVRPYFGDGDECHMAFHFPLMTRMFLALRQEDRHPVTEILTQTPDIPGTCQWALFLRNHDELTLEMVTDEERDYMYQVYAADPQMRLNLGIRRRLAPLVENSRRRVELLNSLLFSLPGTPIVYYGDEVGMGDNIYLGDRNGVRTPMQWSSDRNGGFSRSDPARLVAPPIMDPVYGYQAINVEAQERYPFSLLTWMKRLIAMRKQHRVFGRGSLEFVACPNRKVLAYLRRDDRETILAVVNLARTVQPAELDLKAFAGLVPVEMWGLTDFPRIEARPYFLTLGPYGTYWFTLQQEPMQVTSQAAAPADPIAAVVQSLPSLLMGADWHGMLDGSTRTVLEREALAPFLQRQPWFAGKTKPIRQARFRDWLTIRAGATPAFVAIVVVDYVDSETEHYVVPLALVTGAEADRVLGHTPGSVLARIAGARRGVAVDGWQDDDTCERLVALIGRTDETATKRGRLQGRATGRPLDLPAERTWVRASSDQNKSVLFISGRYMLKLFRRVEPGPNPGVELGRYFAEHGFVRTPAIAGALEYDRPGAEPATLGLVEVAAEHQGSGWNYSIDDLRRYYERVAARVSRSTDSPAQASDMGPRDGTEPPPFFSALEHWYLSSAATLGRRTADMHAALAAATEPALAPEPMTRSDIHRLADQMRMHAETALGLLQERLASLGDSSRPHADAVLAARGALVSRLDRMAAVDPAGLLRTRIHGDYGLGQVLRTDEDFMIIDFEGNPARSLAERRAKQSPLKDVAGMIRSFGYAAYAALSAFAVHTPDDYAALEPWADEWQRWAAAAFLASYRLAIAPLMTNPAIVPADAEVFGAMLTAFVVDKAFDELTYELDGRPDWVRIPLAGLLRLANG
jgi:maltose alpha-D-glucosyltransferase/alpha-amylase